MTPAIPPNPPNDQVDVRMGELQHGETHRNVPPVSPQPTELESREDLIIPGAPETIAEETERISPEKRPADPKMGPKALRLEILALWGLVLILSVVLAFTFNPFAGVAAFALGTIGLMLNPVVGATEQRAEEREIVAEHHREPVPGEVVVRTTSKRKERRFNRSN